MIATASILQHEAYYLWLRRMLRSKQMGISATITFTPEGLRTESPLARGEIGWRGIEQIQNVPGGLFLRPGKGISIYLHSRPGMVEL